MTGFQLQFSFKGNRCVLKDVIFHARLSEGCNFLREAVTASTAGEGELPHAVEAVKVMKKLSCRRDDEVIPTTGEFFSHSFIHDHVIYRSEIR